jgi:hypothetical protein
MDRSKKQVILNSNTRYNKTYEGGNKMRDGKARPQFTRDSLQEMSDRDLSSAENALERRISTMRRDNQKTLECEIELCYLQDEIFRRGKMVKQFRRKS